MFFSMLPISNTGGSAADISAIVSFLYPQTQLLFQHGVLILATSLPRLEISQVLHSAKSITMFSLFDSYWGKQNDSTTCQHQLHPQYQVFQQKKCLSFSPDYVGGGSAPFEFHSMEETPPLKFPHILYLGQSAAKSHQNLGIHSKVSIVRHVTSVL